MTSNELMKNEADAEGSGCRPAARLRPGLMERTFTKLFTSPATVRRTVDLSPDFRMIDFQHDALKGASWQPGDKVQVKLDGGFITRTYTPIGWDTTQGTTSFLAYCHGPGPGSAWARSVAAGDMRQFFGPRRSLSLSDTAPSAILFGDETSFALAAVLQETSAPIMQRSYVFEVNDPHQAEAVLAQLGLHDAIAIQRRDDDGHLGAICEAILAAADHASTFILSGRAPSLQYVTRTSKAAGIGSRSIRTKAYWGPGKAGLD